jgi:dTDP-4-dehydrorhamnose reductase
MRTQGRGDVILVTGASGLIGGALAQKLRSKGAVVWAPPRLGNDALDLAKISSTKLPARITTAFLCAWHGSVAEAAQDPRGTHQVNVEGTRQLIDELRQTGAKIVFLSTSLVFSCADTSAYAPLSPCCLYGKQKASAESFCDVREDVIIRITKVGETLLPRLKHWSNSLRAGGQVAAAGHLRVAPVMLGEVVAGLAGLAYEFTPGIYQMSARRDYSYLELANFLALRVGGLVTDDPGAGTSFFQTFPKVGCLKVTAPERCEVWPSGDDHVQSLVQTAIS